jgi:hypothetical protein
MDFYLLCLVTLPGCIHIGYKNLGFSVYQRLQQRNNKTKQKPREKKNGERCPKGLWGTIKATNTHVRGVLEEQNKQREYLKQ